MARTQCSACPWRDLASVPEYALTAARQDPTGFVCHTRCGPCPGPMLARLDARLPDPEETT
jgi:hypothetical protein